MTTPPKHARDMTADEFRRARGDLPTSTTHPPPPAPVRATRGALDMSDADYRKAREQIAAGKPMPNGGV
jgi:hypothetical protein